jgi:hypothetical protein
MEKAWILKFPNPIFVPNPHARLGRAPRNRKIILRIQRAKESRIQAEGMEVKTLEPYSRAKYIFPGD